MPTPDPAPVPRSAWSDLACAVLPALVLFGLIPLALYVPNREELGTDPRVLLPFAAALAAWTALAGLALIRRSTIPARTWAVFLVAGVALALRDALCPVRATGLVGLDPGIRVLEPAVHIAVEAAIAVAATALAVLAPPQRLRAALLPVAFGFTLIQFATTAPRLFHAPRPHAAASLPPASPTPAPAEGGNVYLICLDSFQAHPFPDIVRDRHLADDLAGFTFFPHNRANYTFTWPSLASAFTGTFYTNGSMSAWIDAGRRHGGLLSAYAHAGYAVWQYGIVQHDVVSDARYRNISRLVTRHSRAAVLRHLWAVRIAPIARRGETHARRQGDTLRLATAGTIAGSVPLLRRVVDDEPARPARGQCVVVHAYLPHQPYLFDADCREHEGPGRFDEQAACALCPVVDLVRELKASGKFHDATILIFADHGTTVLDERPAAETDGKRLREARRRLGSPAVARLDALSSALLLVKPPSADVAPPPLAISTRTTQNADIPATLQALTGVAMEIGQGLPVLAADWPEWRDINVFDGFEERIFRRVMDLNAGLGIGPISAPLDHHRRLDSGAWTNLPPIACRW